MTVEEALAILGLERPRGGKLACPAHEERTPSLHLYEETESFYCFSCGANGDMFGLVALFQGRPVGDVLKEYGDGNVAQVRKVSKGDMIAAEYARWVRASKQAHDRIRAATDDLPWSETSGALDSSMRVADEKLGSLRAFEHFFEDDPAPFEVAQVVNEAIWWALSIAYTHEQLREMREESNGLFRPDIQPEVREAGRPGGSSLRAGVPIRGVGGERVEAAEGVDVRDDGRNEALTRLLQRRLLGGGGGLWG